MGSRPDPLDEIKRTWALLTRRERIEFLSWLATAPDCQREAVVAPQAEEVNDGR